MHLLDIGPAQAWNVFLAGEDYKKHWTFEIFETHACLWPGAQMWFRHKWRKVVTASLLLLCIDWFSCLRYWNEFFFQRCFRFSIEVFSYCSLTEMLAIGFQKWFDHEWIDFVVLCFFLLETGFLRWLHICMDWSLQELLNCYSFLSTSIFFEV